MKWSADLIDMKEFSKDNKGYNYLFNVIDIFSKFAWSIPLKTKTGPEFTKAFETILTNKNHPKNCGSIKVLNFKIRHLINY